MPMQLLHLQKKKRSGILSNLQPDNSMHVTHPDKWRIALMLKYRKRSQFVTGWGHWMVTKRCRQRNLHEMSYTIKYRVKTRMATGVAVSTERVK